jgi:hypothetical protein
MKIRIPGFMMKNRVAVGMKVKTGGSVPPRSPGHGIFDDPAQGHPEGSTAAKAGTVVLFTETNLPCVFETAERARGGNDDRVDRTDNP